jgi:tRNA(Arg) A34 adenosine deaminase TadA
MLVLDYHNSVALALWSDDAPRMQSVYHDADYARCAARAERAPLKAEETLNEGQSKFMRQAIQLATENVRGGRGGPFGAVVVRDGVVLATGTNQVTALSDPTAHAEVVAIRSACQTLGQFQLRGCDVYTSCEPCPMCLAALYWSRCRAIYYGNSAGDAAKIGFNDSFLYDEVKKPLNERTIPIQRMMADEAWESFAAWESSPMKVEY